MEQICNKANELLKSGFINRMQMSVILETIQGDEGTYFKNKFDEYYERIQNMPQIYEQDGKGDKAVVYLHYFSGSSDWYITEKDTFNLQKQAFGYVVLNGNTELAELGYINLEELARMGVELDLYWEPKTLRDALKERS